MTDDPAAVEVAVVRVLRLIADARRVELLHGSRTLGDRSLRDRLMGDPAQQPVKDFERGLGALEFAVRSGTKTSGRICLYLRNPEQGPLRSDTIRQIITVCTVAASALENLSRRREWQWQAKPGLINDSALGPPPRSGASAGVAAQPSVALHDATFLNAVLPFALSQARRHREPLSLLCVGTDRLGAIEELLGRAVVDQLIRRVGETIASLIRTSDIVARLDDDRVAVVLPRAPVGGALHVAEKIAKAFAVKHPLEPGLPTGVTVSVGVASFPTCADDVYSLFDAADAALAHAQRDGRSRLVVASAPVVSVADDGETRPQ